MTRQQLADGLWHGLQNIRGINDATNLINPEDVEEFVITDEEGNEFVVTIQ